MERNIIVRERTERRIESPVSREKLPPGIELIRLVYKNRLLLFFVTLVAGLSAALFTSAFFMQPEYKSETIIYPSGSNTSVGLINSDMRFGLDRDVDNEIQVLQSTILRDSMLKKYHLMEHYGIDPGSDRKLERLYAKYNDRVSFDRTRYNSIVIKVYDTDPALAAWMANDIVTVGDKVKAEIVKKNLQNAYNTIHSELNDKAGELKHMGDSIVALKRDNYNKALALRSEHFNKKKETVENLRKSLEGVRSTAGIYNFDEQYTSLYNTWLQARANYVVDSGMVAVMGKYLPERDTSLIRKKGEQEGSRILMENLGRKLASLEGTSKNYNKLQDDYGFEKEMLSGLKGEYEYASSTFEKEFSSVSLETLKNKYAAEMELFNGLKSKYELALSNLTDRVPAAYVISPAEPSHKKAWPPRTLITVLTMLSAFLLTLALLAIAEQYRRIAPGLKS